MTTALEQRVARGLTLVPERRELFAAMTVADNLLLGAFQRFRAGEKTIAATQDEIYQRFPRLAERRAQLTGGEQDRLARVVGEEPELEALAQHRVVLELVDHIRPARWT